MLDLVALRGAAQKAANFERVYLIERQMTKVKNENFELFCTPNYMFCTFNHEDAFLAAEQIKDFELCDGETVAFKRAKQPSNLIWENVEITKK